MASPAPPSSSSQSANWDPSRRPASDSGTVQKNDDNQSPHKASVPRNAEPYPSQHPFPASLYSNDPLTYQAYPRQVPAMPHPDEQRQRQLSVHMPPSHPHAPGYTPTDSQHFIPQPPPPHNMPASAMPDQMRYGEQAYAHMRPVYPAQMYYDPAMATDYSVDPTHPGPPPPHAAPVYPSITTRTSPVNAYSPQAAIPPFHPTTPPVPQAPWTGPAPYYGTFGGMAAAPPPGQPPLTDEMGHRRSIPSVYLSHPPTSAWSSPVLSTPFQFFSPFQSTSPQMDRVESMGSPTGEQWAPSPTGARPPMRPPFVPGPQPPHAAASQVAWSNLSPNPASLDSKRPSVSTPGDEPTKASSTARPLHDKERKEYHPQPPARRSEWVMWVGNVPSNVSHEELWRFFNTTVPTNAQGGATEPWRGPSSIFLISRSSCAFVNFSSQADLDRAVPFFNGLSLRPWDNRCPRMVCRVRHKDDDLRAGVGAQRGVGMHRAWVEQHKQPERKDTGVSPRSGHLELPEGEAHDTSSSSNHKSSASFASTNSSFLAHHFPRRYFILKSLSTSDLDDSVKEGTWRTQRHNQPILDQAFRTSQEVILIFGANRSGEFFGYAKMASASVKRKPPPERQMTSARSSYGPNKQGSTNLLTINPGGPGDSPRSLRRHHPGSTPAPIREEDDGDREQLRSATDPYRRISNYLTPGYARASSPSQLSNDDDVLRIANLEISEEEGALLRSESPDLMDEITRRASNATLDPNLLRGDRRESRQYRMGHLEHSSSLQIQVGGRKDTMPRRPSEVIAEHAESPPDSSDPLAPAFKIEWIKVGPLSFSRTRHLRNPWNGDREVKVSRDGTEVEPNVGALLLAEWDKLESNKESASSTTKSSSEPSSPPSGKQAAPV